MYMSVYTHTKGKVDADSRSPENYLFHIDGWGGFRRRGSTAGQWRDIWRNSRRERK